jgi:hypothetical protein
MLKFHYVLIIFHYGWWRHEIFASTNLSDCVPATDYAPLRALPTPHHPLVEVCVCGAECAGEILIYDRVADDLRPVLHDAHMWHSLCEQFVPEELPPVEDNLEVGRLSGGERREERLDVHHREGRELRQAEGRGREWRGEAEEGVAGVLVGGWGCLQALVESSDYLFRLRDVAGVMAKFYDFLLEAKLIKPALDDTRGHFKSLRAKQPQDSFCVGTDGGPLIFNSRQLEGFLVQNRR